MKTTRLWRAMLVVFGLLLASQNGLAAPGETGDPRRLIAVGDLHGDHDAFRAILTAADLIDADGRWRGGDDVLVQTGDIADRGPDSRAIIDDLKRLQKEAARAGGAVHVLIGNHEAMNIIGDLRYVHPGEYAAFADRRSKGRRDRYYRRNRKAIEARYREATPGMAADAIRATWEAATPLGLIEHRQAWAPDGEIGAWILDNATVLRLGGVIFVHGGIGPAYSTESIASMNERVRTALASVDQSPESVLVDENGPLWYRGYFETDGVDHETRLAEITAMLAAQEATRIVVAHTPQLAGVTSLFSGAVIAIDTGASSYYGGTRSFLRFEGGSVFAHDNGVVSAVSEE